MRRTGVVVLLGLAGLAAVALATRGPSPQPAADPSQSAARLEARVKLLEQRLELLEDGLERNTQALAELEALLQPTEPDPAPPPEPR